MRPLWKLANSVSVEAVRAFRQDLTRVATCGRTQLVRHWEHVDDDGVRLNRVERYVDLPEHDPCYSAAFHDILVRTQLDVSILRRESMSLFKDKTNILTLGGGSFVAHQDTPAFRPFGAEHVTALVPLTPYTADNGCVEFASMNAVDGEVPMAELAHLDYTPVPLDVGDVVYFDGLLPHRSRPNTTDEPRIGLYLTFVPSTDPACTPAMRAEYYHRKEEDADGMSLNQIDYSGRVVC